MIADVTGLTGYNAADYETEKSSDSLGQDTFLTLMMAQLQYQDPMNPMENTEYTAQLAQFSQLEQLSNMSESIKSLVDLQNSANSNNALEYIGKYVEAEGNILNNSEGKTSYGSFTTTDEADCTIYIKDTSGYTVREMNLGNLNAGLQSFTWDGRNNDGVTLDDGYYMFEIEAIMGSGDLTAAQTYIKGQVDRINMEGDQPVLYIGDIGLSMSEVVDISLAEAE